MNKHSFGRQSGGSSIDLALAQSVDEIASEDDALA
jgi:hypothetical protein